MSLKGFAIALGKGLQLPHLLGQDTGGPDDLGLHEDVELALEVPVVDRAKQPADEGDIPENGNLGAAFILVQAQQTTQDDRTAVREETVVLSSLAV
jgi:hypothetical protein